MSWDALQYESSEPAKEPTWGDYGNIVKGATGTLASSTVGGLRYMYDLAGTNSPWADKTFQAMEGLGNAVAKEAHEDMSEGARKRYEAGITSPEFWEHPGSSIAMKLTGQIPNIVAMATPAGFISRARAAGAAVMAAGGTLSVGELVNNVYQQVDEAPDDKLKEQSPRFAQLLTEHSDDPDEARRIYRTELMGMKPAIAFALGSAEGALGPIKNIISGVKGGVRHGIVRSAVGGAGSEAVEEGGVGTLTQTAEIEGGFRKNYDPMALVDQALTGGALGGILGGVSGIGGKGKAKADEIRAKRAGEEDTEVSAATLQEQIAARQEGITPKGAAKNEAVAVDPAIAAALAGETNKPPPAAEAPEVPVPTPPPAAATPPVQQPAAVTETPGAPQEPTPPPATAPQQATAPNPPAAAPAPVTSGVTLDENLLTELARRGVHPDEAAQLNQQQIDEAMKRPVGGGSAQTAPQPAAQPAGMPSQITNAMKAELRARGVTDEAIFNMTPGKAHEILQTPASPASAAPQTGQVPSGPPVTPTESFGPAEAAVPAVSPTTTQVEVRPDGTRVFTNVKQEDVDATTAAVNKTAKETLAGPKPEKAIKPQKLAKIDKDAQDARTAKAVELFPGYSAKAETEHLPVPKDKKERQALGERLKPLVMDLKTKMELREDVSIPLAHIKKYYNKGKGSDASPSEKDRVRWHSSLPGRVGGVAQATGEARSVHTQYLRELIDVQKILEKGSLGSKPENTLRRIHNFIAAYNAKSPDLIHMSRTEAGQERAASLRGATAEQAEGALAKTEAGATTKGAVITPESEGAAGKGVVLEGEAREKALAETNKRLQEQEAAKKAAADELARPVAEKPAETPKGPAVVAAAKEKAKDEVTPEVTKPTISQAQVIKYAAKKDISPKAAREALEAEAAKAAAEPVMTVEMLQDLTTMGYSDAAIRQLSADPKKAQHIIDEGIQPTKKEAREETDEAVEDDEHEAARSELAEAEQAKARQAKEAAEEAKLRKEAGAKEAAPDPRVAEIDAAEARKKADLEELSRSNVKSDAPARPKTETQAASAEELAKLVPKGSVAGQVVTKRRAVAPPKPKATPEEIRAAREAYAKVQAEKAAAAEAPGIKRRGAAAHPLNRPEVKLEPGEQQIWDTPIHKARDMFGHEAEDLSPPMRAADVLRNIDLSHLPDLPQYLQGFTRRRLIEIMGDMDVYFASDALVSDVSGDYHAPSGYYDENGKGHIVINSDALRTPGDYAHTVMHEAIHAALVARMNSNPKFRARVEKLMGELRAQTKAHGSRTDIETARYALTDPQEFIAELQSNAKLQELMSKMYVSPQLVAELGLPPTKKWTLWGAFTHKVRELLGLPPGAHNFLHEAMRVVAPELEAGRVIAQNQPGGVHKLSIDALKDAAVGALPNANTKVNAAGTAALVKDKLSTFGDLGQRAEGVFGDLGNQLFTVRAKMETAKDDIIKKYGSEEATAAMARAEREHPELMTRIKDIGFRASALDINLDGSNEHLGKKRLMTAGARAEVAALQKEWNNPALNAVRPAVQKAMKFFKDIHNATSRATIKNLLAEAGIHDEALVDRIHTTGLTEADEKAFANTKLVSALNQVSALKQRKGSYIPFRRYGDFISAANHELSVPANATKVNDNTLQFVDPAPKNGEYSDTRTRAAVESYLAGNSHTPQGNKLQPAAVKHVWVDSRDHSKIVEGEDPHAVHAYQVSMQVDHVEMHQTRAEALDNQKALKEAGLLNDRSHAREEAYKTDVTNIQSAMGTVLRSLTKQQRYINATPEQKLAMRETFHDLTLGLSGTTSIKNSMRHRRNVAGMSHDLGRVTADYSRMTANHLAMLQFRPQMDAVFEKMRDHMEANKYDKDAIRREELYKEFTNRIYGKAADRAEEHKPGAISRLLQVTRLGFLAGPSYHIINMHEVITTAMPVVGGRHGFGAAIRAMKDAYSLIGGRGGLMAGFRDTVKAYTNDSGFTDYVKLFKDTIGKSKTASPDEIRRQQELLDYARERNLYSNTSIFEQAKYANPTGNVAGRVLDRIDLMANQVGSAIEAINRSVTLLMAYKLEYRKNGGNHEAAMSYAHTTALNTMGNYAAWNAAPAFNTTIGRPLLQFKKYPLKMYSLMGNMMGGIIKGDKQAMKQFVGLMVTHGMIAGALGMPTEPFKAALLAANAFGITGFTPDDYDYAVRQLAARAAGQKGGEIISKGLYRGLGIELSGRTGLNELALRGAPKSQKDTDIKSFLFDTMAGASGAFLINQYSGLQALKKGDVATAIEKMSPLRTVGDITKAITGAAGDRMTDSGKVRQEQFGPWDTFVRLMGFTPSSAAEYSAARGHIRRETEQLSAARKELINGRLEATGYQIVNVQRAIQAFNASVDKDNRITPEDLTNAAKRRKTDAKKTIHGTTTTKQNRAIQTTVENTFNL